MKEEKRKYHHGDLRNALIKAGTEILSAEGLSGLSLRKVARRAGVSHAAPYAHFKDKRDLIAAISTEGYLLLYNQIRESVERFKDDPRKQLQEAAWAYVDFALNDPDHFRVTLSGIVEKDKEQYPDYVRASKESFALVQEIVRACQERGILKKGPTEEVAVAVWSLIHGFASLLIDGQLSHSLLESRNLKELLLLLIEQITLPYQEGKLIKE